MDDLREFFHAVP
jgi:hypothetical protein